MSTNFQQWNPSSINQESDSQYTSDALRSGGATTDAILPSPTANKAFYQWSTFVAAMATSLSNKGYVVDDTNFATLVSVLANIRTNADIIGGIATVSYATSVVFPAGTAPAFYLDLTGNVSSSSITGSYAGQVLTFVIQQDSTGGRTMTWPVTSPVLNGIGTISPLANSISIQSFIVLPGGGIWATGPMVVITAAGLVSVASQLYVNPTAITATGKIPAGNNWLMEKINAGAAAVTRTMFTAVGNANALYTAKKIDSSNNIVTILPFSGQTIDGQTSGAVIAKQYNSVTLASDGSNLFII